MWVSTLLSLLCLIAFHLLRTSNVGDFFPALEITALTCFYHLAVRLAIGEWLIPRVDMRKINCEGWWFRLHGWEARLYRFLGIERWRRRLPTYDPSEFDLYQLGAKGILRSNCRAELTHELNAVASFVPLYFARRFGAFPAFLTTSIIAAGIDLAFVVVQRYNRPRLIRLLRRLEKRLRAAGIEADSDE